MKHELHEIPVRLLRDLARSPLVPEELLDAHEEASGGGYDSPVELHLREHQVLALYSHGLTREMIADALHVSVETVKTYLKSARYRLGAKNTAHAACIAIRRGLIN